MKTVFIISFANKKTFVMCH